MTLGVETRRGMKKDTEYDPVKCVTAKELRDIGWPVPHSVPECAWVPRSSLVVDDCDMSASENRLDMSISVKFTVPFQWVKVNNKFWWGEERFTDNYQ